MREVGKKECLACGDVFAKKPRVSYSAFKKRKFCSLECYHVHQKDHPNSGTFKKGARPSPKTEFKKGHKPWNTGKKLSDEHIEKLSRAKKENPSPSQFKKGHPFHEGGEKGWFKKGQEPWSKGKLGKDSPAYIDGRSFEPYPPEWNNQLKDRIKARDGYLCQCCGKSEDLIREEDSLRRGLSVHHIDYDKQNCEEENLVALCKKCNSVANGDRKHWEGHYKKLINCKV